MQFHLGKPILLLTCIAALSGGAILLPRSQRKSDLTVWVFAEAHRDAYRSLLPDFGRRTGQRVELDLMAMNALNVRLTSLFMSPGSSSALPDAAEIEINFMARYLRPPVREIGFLPLNRFLENSGFREIRTLHDPGESGWHARLTGDGKVYRFDGQRWLPDPGRSRPDAWIDRIVRNRLTPWMKHGRIFGVPHDVHPVTITYRADLFQDSGVDLETARTWPEFQDLCLRFQAYWSARGVRYRHAMELGRANCENLMQMLLQRHVNLIDDRGRVRINDPRVTATLAFYVQLVAGPRRIGVPAPKDSELWAQDLNEGNVCALMTPDWKLQQVRRYAGLSAGKLRMMPLPQFDPTDSRTSTWGGTMVGIPRDCPRPNEAWKLIEKLYFSPEGLDARFQQSEILPPLPEEWSQPVYHQPDPVYGGQDVMGLYAKLAPEIPAYYVSSTTPLALAELSYVLNKAAAYVDERGTNGLADACQHWLDEAAADLRARIQQSAFSPDDATP